MGGVHDSVVKAQQLEMCTVAEENRISPPEEAGACEDQLCHQNISFLSIHLTARHQCSVLHCAGRRVGSNCHAGSRAKTPRLLANSTFTSLISTKISNGVLKPIR